MNQSNTSTSLDHKKSHSPANDKCLDVLCYSTGNLEDVKGDEAYRVQSLATEILRFATTGISGQNKDPLSAEEKS